MCYLRVTNKKISLNWKKMALFRHFALCAPRRASLSPRSTRNVILSRNLQNRLVSGQFPAGGKPSFSKYNPLLCYKTMRRICNKEQKGTSQYHGGLCLSTLASGSFPYTFKQARFEFLDGVRMGQAMLDFMRGQLIDI